jgi:hypothetical protein
MLTLQFGNIEKRVGTLMFEHGLSLTGELACVYVGAGAHARAQGDSPSNKDGY